MYRTPKAPSLVRRIGISASLGVLIAALGIWLELLVSKSGFSMIETIDDIIIGIAAALVVFTYEQQRSRAITEKIRVIAGMNHHVRNALQAISYAPYTEQERQIKMVEESVNRIEWALREILPGEPVSEDEKARFPQPAPSEKFRR